MTCETDGVNAVERVAFHFSQPLSPCLSVPRMGVYNRVLNYNYRNSHINAILHFSIEQLEQFDINVYI